MCRRRRYREPRGRPDRQGRGQEPHRLRRSWTSAASTACCTSDIAWRRVKHPSEVLKIGDEIEARYCATTARQRVSLGLAGSATIRGGHHPPLSGGHAPVRQGPISPTTARSSKSSWASRPGTCLEMDWTNKNIHPPRWCRWATRPRVMVLDIDTERRSISLGMKQCQPNPWEEFSANHQKNEKISGKIVHHRFRHLHRARGGIDGLIHLSDLSWQRPGERRCVTTRRATISRRSSSRSIRT